MDKKTEKYINTMIKRLSKEKVALMFWIHRSTLDSYLKWKPVTEKTLKKMKSNADLWNSDNLDALTDWVK